MCLGLGEMPEGYYRTGVGCMCVIDQQIDLRYAY